MADFREFVDERHDRYCLLTIFTPTELTGKTLPTVQEPDEYIHVLERRSKNKVGLNRSIKEIEFSN